MALTNINPNAQQMEQWKNSNEYKAMGEKFLANINNGINNSNVQNEAQTAINTMFAQPQQPQYNPMDTNSQLVEMQKANKLAGFTGAYNASISNLDRQDAKIDPQAYQDRSKTSTSSQLGARSLAEYMANRGQTNSGFANQSELTRNMQLQNDIGGIDLQARNMHNNIATSKTDLANALQTDIQGANAGIEAESLQRQMQMMQQEQQRQDQLNQSNKTFDYNAGRDIVADTRYTAENTYNQGRDTIGDNRYKDTNTYNQGRDKVADTRYNTETAYDKSRDIVGDTRYANEIAYKKAQDLIDNNARNQALNISRAKASSGGGSGKGGVNPTKPASQTTIKDIIKANFNKALANNQGKQWLIENEKNIKSSLTKGADTYKTLYNEASKTVNVVKEKTKTRALNNNSKPQY